MGVNEVMYEEHYERRGFPFRKFIVGLFIVVLLVLGGVWIYTNYFDNESKSSGQCTKLSDVKDKKTRENIEIIKNVALEYFTKDKVEEKNKNLVVYIDQLIEENRMETLFNDSGIGYHEKSYIELVKEKSGYSLFIHLRVIDDIECIKIKLEVSDTCGTYLCVKTVKEDTTQNEEKQQENNTVVEEIPTVPDNNTNNDTTTPPVNEEVVNVPSTSTSDKYDNIIQYEVPYKY